MQKHRQNLQNSEEINKVQTFKSHILNGPFYICFVCNRCLYKHKYDCIAHENVFESRIESFDGKEYICKTCHTKLIMKKRPCQAVINSLQIYNLPECFEDIRRLEKS